MSSEKKVDNLCVRPIYGQGQNEEVATTWGKIFTRHTCKQVRRGKAVIATAESLRKGAVREVHTSCECVIAPLPPLPCARTTHAILTAFVDFAVG